MAPKKSKVGRKAPGKGGNGAPAHPPRGLYWDPYAFIEAFGYREKPSPLTYTALRSLPFRVPILGAMIINAVDTVGRFCRPPKDRFGSGLVVKPKGQDYGKLSPADRKFSDRMLRGLLRGTFDENAPRGYSKLGPMLKALTWDSYAYDQVNYETIPDSDGRPATWLPTDASTVRLACAPYTYPITAFQEDEDLAYTMQVHEGQVTWQYSFEEMAFAIRNPRTSILIGGYGTAEGEMCMHTLARIMNADTYNDRVFSGGTHAKGLLNVKGNIGPEKFDEFRRDFYSQSVGVKNAHTTPLTRAPEGLDFIDFRMSHKEMEFSGYYDFQIKVTGAHMLMDPAEIHFRYGNEGQKSSLNGENNRERMIDSRARWLPPLLDFHADHLTTYLIEPWDRDWEAAFVNVDGASPNDLADLYEKRVRTTHTLNEAREDQGLKPVEGGEIPLNATFVQWMQSQQAMAQAEDQGAEIGAPGRGGDEGGGDTGEDDGDGAPAGEDAGGGFDDLLAQLGGGDDEEEAPRGRLRKSRRAYEVEV